MIRKQFDLGLENVDVSVTANVEKQNQDRPITITKVQLKKPGLIPLDILPYLDQIDIDMLIEQVQLDVNF